MEKRILGIIPARSGSKRIPNKNIRTIHGKPLICWTIREALRSKYLTDVILSTDSLEIAQVGVEFGCNVPFIRPSSLSGDGVSSIDVVLHAIDCLRDYEFVMLLQPTSPLRTASDIDAVVASAFESQFDSVVSVTDLRKPWNFVIEVKDDIVERAVIPRDSESCSNAAKMLLNGAIYFSSVEYIRKYGRLYGNGSGTYRMPEARSIDIDDDFDWNMAEFFLRNRDNQ